MGILLLIFLVVPIFGFTTGENLYSISDANSASLALSNPDFSNPVFSSLSVSEKLQVTAGELYWNTACQKISFVLPGKTSVGFSVSQFRTESSDVVDEFGEYGGFYQQEFLASAGVSKRVGKLSVGLAADFFRQKIYTENGSAVAVAAGFSYIPLGRRVISRKDVYMPVFLGFWIRNVFGTALNTGDKAEKLPVNFNFYSAFYFLAGKVSLFQRFRLADFFSKKERNFSAGISVRLTSEITLSAGRSAAETSAGISVSVGRFDFDLSNSASDLGNRFSASLSFDFAYIKNISEKILKEKKKEIEKLKKQILDLKESSDLMGDEERDYLLKMTAQAFKQMSNRQFSKAAATMKEILSRYEYKIKKQPPPISKKEARVLASSASKLMEERRYAEAKTKITKALKVLSGDPFAEETSHLIDAYIQIEKGNYLLAKAILAEGLVIKPDSEKMIDLMRRIDRFMRLMEIKK
ncbi:MAG: hypothetical protein J7L54_05345 [Elusimicrobia bacterium]|nr:hypothetical protein [Elusimicrobiota bacterium]